MMLLPAIDLKDGQSVQLVGGDPAQSKVQVEDVLGQAQGFVRQGAAGLHVVDLDAALETGTDNRGLLESLVRSAGVPVQVGGGVRSAERIEELLGMGAKRVIVGTRAAKDPDWLKQCAQRFGQRLIVAVDARGGEVVVRGWREGSGIKLLDFVKQVDKLGVGGLLFTNVDLEGKLTGINEMVVKSVVDAVETPVYYAGGISTVDEVLMLHDLGCAGAVIGMALHTGRIDLQEALRALER